MTGLESLGQQPLELGSALGGRIANATGANALYGGGMAAANSMAAANAYNPFATALVGASRNPAIQQGFGRLFGGGGGGAGDSAGMAAFSGAEQTPMWF